ncbi:MAG: hypothetical protein KDA24_12715 [Deltaproteobacteria bacterium]|nr:hypothetical protein [Deltaproteobacteria bacterium]
MTESEFDTICTRLEIPPALRKHIAPGAGQRARMAVARGILPTPPKTLLAMQYVLVGDDDPEVAAAAEKSLVSMPPRILSGLLNMKTHGKVLEFLAYKRTQDEELMERIVLMRQVNDKTMCFLAENGTDRVAEMISQNQERLIITPQILRFLQRNPHSLASTLERVVTFLRLHGINLDEPTPEELAASEAARKSKREAELAETAPQPSPAPAAAKAPAIPAGPASGQAPAPFRVSLPPDFVPGEFYVPPLPEDPYEAPAGLQNPLADLLADWGITMKPEYLAPPDGVDVAGPPILSAPVTAAGAPAPQANAAPRVEATLTLDLTGLTSLGDSEFAFGFEEEADDFDPYLTKQDDSHTSDEMKGDIKKVISAMKMGDKIKLAYKGNKAVREVLIRDTNKVVACAVVKSGRLTDNEVVAIASNRAVAEDVIRELARVKENLRMYPVKVALCSNPKTPVPVAMRLINSLHVSDLKSLARNRNVSSAVFTAANKLYRFKGSTRNG